MLKKIIRRVSNTNTLKPLKSSLKTVKPAKKNANVYDLAYHGIERHLLSRGALEVCQGLSDAGFEAYVVGGAVRDWLLAKDPKDFDIATNAKPEQIVKLFRRARLIGKRFVIVHVMVGRELIEVTTFRGADDSKAHTDNLGRVLTDNVYGTLITDAQRRDLTVNALYYNPINETVLDFHHGLDDLQQRRLRIIGDPESRYREDPVRMLRILRFAAKLDFSIAKESLEPITHLKSLVSHCPAGRLFEEVQKLLLSGYAFKTLALLKTLDLNNGLLPVLDVVSDLSKQCLKLNPPVYHLNTTFDAFIEAMIRNTDERIHLDQSTSPSFLFACLLWYAVLIKHHTFLSKGQKPIIAREQAIALTLQTEVLHLGIPRRYAEDMALIWQLQLRFEDPNPKSGLKVLSDKRFRSGYDFFLLRCQSGEQPSELGELWTTLHTIYVNDSIDNPSKKSETLLLLLKQYKDNEHNKDNDTANNIAITNSNNNDNKISPDKPKPKRKRKPKSKLKEEGVL